LQPAGGLLIVVDDTVAIALRNGVLLRRFFVDCTQLVCRSGVAKVRTGKSPAPIAREVAGNNGIVVSGGEEEALMSVNMLQR